MRRIRTCYVAATSLVLAACTASHDSAREEPTNTTAHPIWNGVPGDGPVVLVTSGKQEGSGVALTNNWVLTALHTVNKNPWTAAIAQVGGTGTKYNATSVTAITNVAWPSGSGSATGTDAYDLALVRFPHMPIAGTTEYKTNIFQRKNNLPGTTTDQIVDLGQVDCWGYGLGGPGGGAGELRHAVLDVQHDDMTETVPGYGNPIHFAAPVNFFTTATGGKQVVAGDSGGGCFRISDYSLVGIIRANDDLNNNPAPRGIITSVGAYSNQFQSLDKQLQLIVDRNPRTAQFGGVDGDDNPDLLAVSVDGGYVRFQMLLTNVPFLPGGLVDFNASGLLSNLIPASLIDSALATIGDFDGDGVGDVYGVWEGGAVYLDGRSGVAPTIHVDDSPSCTNPPFDCRLFAPLHPQHEITFSAVRVANTNDDLFDDLEGFVEEENGQRAYYVYYGSEHGLTTPTYVGGFPTSDGEDGKLLVLAPPASVHVGVPDYTFQITSYHLVANEPNAAEDRLHVEVFDGDMALSHDMTWLPGGGNSDGAHTCFVLYTDQNVDGDGLNAAPIVIQDDSHFRNNGWSSLFDQATIQEDPNAAIGEWSGWRGYNYLLRVFLTTGACTDPPVYPTGDDVANGMKVRAGGHIFFWDSGGADDGLLGGVTVVGSDNVGSHATKDNDSPLPIPYLGLYEGYDTTYDGQWKFNIATTLSRPAEVGGVEFDGPPTIEQFWLSEADADSLLNPLSPQLPHAIAANEEINFAVVKLPGLDPVLDPGFSFFQPGYPSGQYDPPQAPCVSYRVTPSPGHPFPAELFWVWSDVMSRNYLWLAAPTAQAPGTCAASTAGAISTQSSNSTGEPIPILRMAGENPGFVVPTTSATPITDWYSGEGRTQLEALLPITLGKKHSTPHGKHGQGHRCDGGAPGNSGTVEVRRLQQALRILRMNDEHPHALSAPGLIRSLEAELLIAKLNLARGHNRGEDISRGYIYGSVEKVSDVIAHADETLSEARRGMQCTSPEEIVGVITLLQAINQSNITYRAPFIPAPSGVMNLRSGGTPGFASEVWEIH